jgi:RIO-like serine/threonine protein kinase
MAADKLLKKDVFGEVRRLSGVDGPVILRDTRPARRWARWLARRLMHREARILGTLHGLDGVPRLVSCDRRALVRSYLEGAPLQHARPRDRDFYRRARSLLIAIHRRGIVHNDLAKEPNLLMTPEGRPAFLDFQLAMRFRRRGRLFRVLAYDDLRHLLKHKRSYCPAALTRRERRILSRPALPARAWRMTGKPVYLFVTRRLLGWADREGAGDRFDRR